MFHSGTHHILNPSPEGAFFFGLVVLLIYYLLICAVAGFTSVLRQQGRYKDLWIFTTGVWKPITFWVGLIISLLFSPFATIVFLVVVLIINAVGASCGCCVGCFGLVGEGDVYWEIQQCQQKKSGYSQYPQVCTPPKTS